VVNVSHLDIAVVACPLMIVMIIPIVCSPLMDPLVVVSALPIYKKEDPVVETPILNTKNNVILPVNAVVVALVTNETQINKPHTKIKYL